MTISIKSTHISLLQRPILINSKALLTILKGNPAIITARFFTCSLGLFESIFLCPAIMCDNHGSEDKWRMCQSVGESE